MRITPRQITVQGDLDYTELAVNHDGKDLKFLFHFFFGNYDSVRDQIRSFPMPLRHLRSVELVSLITDPDLLYGEDSENSLAKFCLRSHLNQFGFWEFTQRLVLPSSVKKTPFKDGVLFCDYSDSQPYLDLRDPAAPNLKTLTRTLDVLRKYEVSGSPIYYSSDRNVRFVPFGFSTGDHSAEEFLSHPLIIARYFGKEGFETKYAQKLLELLPRGQFTVPDLHKGSSPEFEPLSLSLGQNLNMPSQSLGSYVRAGIGIITP